MTVEVLAPAKVTLSLRITRVRDDGYHLIDAEMTTVDLCDHLTLSDGDGLEDLYVCDGGGLPNRLYLQNADGTVRDASAES